MIDSILLTQPIQLSISDSLVNVNCFGNVSGSINISVGGGVMPYTFLWSNGDTTQNLYNLSFGNYQITVTDSNNCIVTESINVSQPSDFLHFLILHM